MKKVARRDLAILATVAAAVIWGTSFNVNDVGLRSVGPATFVFMRFAIAGLVTLAVAAFLRRVDITILRDPWIWGIAVANALGFFLQYYGQTLTTPARTALFVNTSAFFAAILERVLFKAPFRPLRVAAIAGGLFGAALLVTGGDISSLAGGRALGDLAVAGAGLAWAIYAIMNNRTVRETGPVNLAAWTFLLTSFVMLPALLLDAEPLRVPLDAVLPIVYTGLVPTAMAFGLFLYGLRALRASTATVLLLVEILVATALSVLILKRETLDPWEIAGGLILFAAFVVMAFVAQDERDVA